MAVLRNNIFANYAGQVWMVLMGVAFVPYYIRILGIEAFGLVGLMLSIQSLSILLDCGMSGMLNREISRRIHRPETAATIATLVRTFESLIWPVAALIALAIWLLSEPLANHWLHPEQLSRAETAHAIAIMGLAVALLWPSTYYANGLSGLERQPVLNVINAFFATLRGGGVLWVLYSISPTISAFMWWYAAMGAAQSLVSALTLWRILPKAGTRPVNFSFAELRAARGFAGGLVAISVLSIAVFQMDRVVVSALRPLEELGYFSLALTVAAGVGRMIQPMFNALYPRYTRLVAASDHKTLVELYHLSNQYLAVVISAVAAVLIVCSKDVLYLWTGDNSTATIAAGPLSILVAGTALNGFMTLPYALQLAHGWTQLTVRANLTALILSTPFCLWAVSHYGILGAACVWLMVNLGFVALAIPLMHRRLMRSEMGHWYLRDILPPTLAAAVVALTVGWLKPPLPRNLDGLLTLGAISVAALAASALAAQPIRMFLLRQLGRMISTDT